MNLDIKNKFFYSLTSLNGYEFGKQYKVIDVIDIEKYSEKPINDYCIIIVDTQGDGEKKDKFFSTMFSSYFTDDYTKIIESIRDSILRQSKELDKLRPIKKITDNKIEELETEIIKLRDLSRKLHVKNKKINVHNLYTNL